MATKTEQKEFVKAIYPAAKALWENQDSIHPLFVTAQAALETGWKLKGADGTNNIFGITKGSTWKGETKLCRTTESFTVPDKKFYAPEWVVNVEKISENRYKYLLWRLFRVYRNMEECLNDHLAVLRKSAYADAWPYRNDPKEYARRISDHVGARYATAENYASAMISTINSVEKLIKELKL
jgi:flagellar protein FlgJ